jgi:hypothetical protein
MSARSWPLEVAVEPLDVAVPAQLSGSTVVTTPVNAVDLAIPGDYRLLRIWWSARIDSAVAAQTLLLTFNGDAGNTYGDQRAEANGSVVAAAQDQAAPGIVLGTALGAASAARSPGVGHAEIPDYSGTTFVKALTGHNFEDRGGTGLRIRPLGGVWRSTAAISSVRLRAAGGGLFSAGSAFGWEVVDPLPVALGV